MSSLNGRLKFLSEVMVVAMGVAAFQGSNSLMVLTWADKPLRAPGSLPVDSKIPCPTVGHIEPGGYWAGVWDALPVWRAVCHDPGILGALEHGIDRLHGGTVYILLSLRASGGCGCCPLVAFGKGALYSVGSYPADCATQG